MDHTELKPYDKVLVRDLNDEEWKIDFFNRNRDLDNYPYVCLSNVWKQCIPYEGNESLLGTTNTPEPKYKFKDGDPVIVWNNDSDKQYVRIFKFKDEFNSYYTYDTLTKSITNWDNCIPFKPKDL